MSFASVCFVIDRFLVRGCEASRGHHVAPALLMARERNDMPYRLFEKNVNNLANPDIMSAEDVSCESIGRPVQLPISHPPIPSTNSWRIRVKTSLRLKEFMEADVHPRRDIGHRFERHDFFVDSRLLLIIKVRDKSTRSMTKSTSFAPSCSCRQSWNG
jgi:hypothetical protein